MVGVILNLLNYGWINIQINCSSFKIHLYFLNNKKYYKNLPIKVKIAIAALPHPLLKNIYLKRINLFIILIPNSHPQQHMLTIFYYFLIC